MGLLPFVKDRVTFLFFNEEDALRMTIVVDATEKAQHKLHAQVTNHPVAQGQALTDNVRPDGDVLTLDCYWSNRTGDIVEQVKRYATGDFSHAEDALADLEVAFRNAWRCTIKMRLKTYESMVIEDVGVPETVEDGASVRATIQFKEIKTAIATTTLQVQTKTTGIGPKKTGGVKTKSPPSNPQKQSAASRLLDNSGASNNSTLFKKP
jgi:hypothetical protein